MHENFGNLRSCNDPVAGVSGLTSVALQEDQMVFVWFVVVESAWTNDGVRETAGADEPFSPALLHRVTPLQYVKHESINGTGVKC